MTGREGMGTRPWEVERWAARVSTCGSSYMHLVLLGTGSWAAQLLTQGILSQWLREVQYELGFQFSHTWKTTRSGHVSFCFQLYWGILKAGEGDDRGWDGWMASPTQWTWVWVNSVTWWWTGRPDALHSTGSQRVGLTEWLNWTDAKSWFTGKDPDAGKDWRREKGMTEAEMVGWHQQLDGHEFGWTPGVGDGQGGLVCCCSWGCRVRPNWATDMKWTELMLKLNVQYFVHLMWRMTHLKWPWCWERLKVGGEGDDRRWDGSMASPTRWIWVWVSFGSWWWTGKPGMLLSMGSQRAGQDWVTELNWGSL